MKSPEKNTTAALPVSVAILVHHTMALSGVSRGQLLVAAAGHTAHAIPVFNFISKDWVDSGSGLNLINVREGV